MYLFLIYLLSSVSHNVQNFFKLSSHIGSCTVGDIFYICQRGITPDQLLITFNSLCSSTKFIFEVSFDETISFLDVLITSRTNGFINRSVFPKPIWNGQYAYLKSFRRLSSRIHKICTEDMVDDEIRSIKSYLFGNGYPKSLWWSICSPNMPSQQHKQLRESGFFYQAVIYRRCARRHGSNTIIRGC